MSDGDFSAILGRAGLNSDASPWREIVDRLSRPSGDRAALLLDVAAQLTNPSDATALLRALAAEPAPGARQLALELAARVPMLAPVLVPWLRPVLRDRRMPRRTLLGAAKALVGVTGERGGATARVLRDFAAGFGRLRVLHFRSALRRHFADIGAFDRLCARLKIVVPLRCPRCGVRRKPQSMVRHLWHRHRRLISGRRVRSPLAWLDDWVSHGPAERDPMDGLAELSRVLIRRELHDAHAESDLEFVAEQTGRLVCPHCLSLIPHSPNSDSVEWLAPLELSDHRMTGEGVAVERSARGMRATVTITDSRGQRTIMPDPRGAWRTAPAIRRLVLPWIGVALIAAVALPAQWAVLGVGLALSIACLFRILVRIRATPEASGSLVDAAWWMVERHPHEFDNRYRARLALTSRGRGRSGARAQFLSAITRDAVSGPIAEWAPLAALCVRDAEATGDDPVRVLADFIGQSLRDDRFAVAVERVLALLPWQDWPLGRLRRLRAAVAERCFEFGLGIRELTELGRALPGFRRLLDSANISGLALLHQVWTLRAERPWPGPKPAATVFELAQYPATGDDVLELVPDALFSVPFAGWGPRGQPTPLVVGERGLWFRGVRLGSPATIEVHLRPYGRGYDLHFGSEQFFYERDPSSLAAVMMAWSEFASRVLAVDSVVVAGEPDGRRLERLLSSLTFACPSCGGMIREQP